MWDDVVLVVSETVAWVDDRWVVCSETDLFLEAEGAKLYVCC